MAEPTTATIKHPDRFFIDGSGSAPSSAAKIDVLDSAHRGGVRARRRGAGADVDRAVAAARKAFDDGPWPRMTHAERAEYLRAIAERARRSAPTTSRRSGPRESGVLHGDREARPIGDPAASSDYYAGLADTFPFEEQRTPTPAAASVGLLVREPVGVVGAIIPWNAPAALIAHKIAPALLAGCTVVLKASPEAPGAGYRARGGRRGDRPARRACSTSSPPTARCRSCSCATPASTRSRFTGSTAAGRRIASICGERIARCTLELGGKSAAVILDDFDLGKAAATIARMRERFLTGQVCSSLTRIVVTKSRHDELVDALAQPFGKVKVGDPFDAPARRWVRSRWSASATASRATSPRAWPRARRSRPAAGARRTSTRG